MAAALDAGEKVEPVIPAAKPVEGEVKPAEVAPVKPEEVKPEAKVGERQRGPDGKFLPKQEPTEPKPTDSKYEAAKKEEGRQKHLLANLENEKAAVRKQAADLAQRERELQQVAAQNQPEATLHGYTAREYAEFVKTCRANGDFEQALKGIEAIQQIRGFEQQYFGQANQKAYEGAFNADMDSVLKEVTALNDANSPEAQSLQKVLTAFPQIFYLEKPFTKAWDLAQKFMAAEAHESSKAEITELKAELAKLRDATQPGVGGPASPAGPRKIIDMTGAELLRMAQDADQSATG